MLLLRTNRGICNYCRKEQKDSERSVSEKRALILVRFKQVVLLTICYITLLKNKQVELVIKCK